MLESLSIRIKAIAEHYRISMRKLCKDVGVSVGALSKQADPRVGTLMKIVAAFPEINIQWLLTGHGEMLRGAVIPFSENFLYSKKYQLHGHFSGALMSCDMLCRVNVSECPDVISNGSIIGILSVDSLQQTNEDIYVILVEGNKYIGRIRKEGSRYCLYNNSSEAYYDQSEVERIWRVCVKIETV